MFKNKKGAMSVDKAVDYAIGMLIVVLLLGALSGSIFGVNLTGAPTWLSDNWNTFIAIGFLLALLGVIGLYQRKRGR